MKFHTKLGVYGHLKCQFNGYLTGLACLGNPIKCNASSGTHLRASIGKQILIKLGHLGILQFLGISVWAAAAGQSKQSALKVAEHCWCYVYMCMNICIVLLLVVHCIHGGAATWGVPSSGGGLNILQRETNDRGQWEMEGCWLSATDACPNVFNVWFWVLFTG